MNSTYASRIWTQFKKHRLGHWSLFVVLLYCFMGVYAPFFASSKPIVAVYNGEIYFPLFRYLFYTGFYTKRIDIFFNLLIFTLPLFLLGWKFLRKRRAPILGSIIVLQFVLFTFFGYFFTHDPASNAKLNQERYMAVKSGRHLTWNDELQFMTPYGKLNKIIDYRNRLQNHKRLEKYTDAYVKGALERSGGKGKPQIPTLWQMDVSNIEQQLLSTKDLSTIDFIKNRQQWLATENDHISFIIMPLFRTYHWEDDAGGAQLLNKFIPWWELTRINRKDLMAALIFGVRISLVVGLLSIGLALFIAVPIGAFAGYYGGRFDIIVSRLLEIWESMPAFFMLLLVVAMIQSKSIFLVIGVIGLFGWPNFSRYLRGEFFKQRNLPYVEACHALGFKDSHIIFSHILPNAIPPVITLLPFAIMGAIASEAGLSFLGLGEEGSCSWGVLMDEGRTAFPGESYLLWPPAILLTFLLVAIALVGDALRDSIDPKLA